MQCSQSLPLAGFLARLEDTKEARDKFDDATGYWNRLWVRVGLIRDRAL